MATSKPCAGTLSTGQRYLVCTTSRRQRRASLAPDHRREQTGRDEVLPESSSSATPCSASGSRRISPSPTRRALAYPCAIEHEGKLYVGYSNSGGGVGRKGQGRELWNNNSAELAVIPVRSLEIKP